MRTPQEASAAWAQAVAAASWNYTTGVRLPSPDEARAAYVRGDIDMDELEIRLGYLGTFRVRRVGRAVTT